MRLSNTALLGTLLSCLCLNALACDPSQKMFVCRINARNCACYYDCKTDDTFRTLQECQDALAELERSSNACDRSPCRRGICIQTAASPGFTCKCEGSGYYGRYCEKDCSTRPTHGKVVPHECIVI